jgi:hypothetical protein
MSQTFDIWSKDNACCGVSHGAELAFNMAATPEIKAGFSTGEFKLMQFMKDEFISIMKTGKYIFDRGSFYLRKFLRNNSGEIEHFRR